MELLSLITRDIEAKRLVAAWPTVFAGELDVDDRAPFESEDAVILEAWSDVSGVHLSRVQELGPTLWELGICLPNGVVSELVDFRSGELVIVDDRPGDDDGVH